MNNNFKKIIFLITSTCLISCATLFTGTKQKIIFDSFPQDAAVKINGELIGNTPIQIKVARKIFKKKIVELSKEGFVTQNYPLKKTINPMIVLNIMFFYGIPADILSGAAVRYEPTYNNILLTATDDSQWNIYSSEMRGNLHIWNKKMRLNWDFFKGMPENLKIDNTLITAAVTASTFLYVFNTTDEVINLRAFSVFNTQRSWVKKKSKSSLNHEQRHFDISEIYSRKFKRKLIESNFENNEIADTIRTIYDEYSKKLYNAQNKYDTETNHGMNEEFQLTWDTQIDKELSETTNFENPYYQIKLKKSK